MGYFLGRERFRVTWNGRREGGKLCWGQLLKVPMPDDEKDWKRINSEYQEIRVCVQKAII